MDLIIIVIFLGILLCGVLIGWVIGYALGQRDILRMYERNNSEVVNKWRY